MHSCSIAVKAVIELCREADRVRQPPRLRELNGRILAFSISHDNRNVRLYGHFALIGEGRTMFYRYPIESIDLIGHNDQNRWTVYSFTRSIYSKFFPEHLQRIRDAITDLDLSRVPLAMSIDNDDPRESHVATTPSQERSEVQLPSLSYSEQLQHENEILNSDIEILNRQLTRLQQAEQQKEARNDELEERLKRLEALFKEERARNGTQST